MLTWLNVVGFTNYNIHNPCSQLFESSQGGRSEASAWNRRSRVNGSELTRPPVGDSTVDGDWSGTVPDAANLQASDDRVQEVARTEGASAVPMAEQLVIGHDVALW